MWAGPPQRRGEYNEAPIIDSREVLKLGEYLGSEEANNGEQSAHLSLRPAVGRDNYTAPAPAYDTSPKIGPDHFQVADSRGHTREQSAGRVGTE